MKLSQIYEGWRNKLIPPESLKEIIEQTHKERIDICRGCPFNSTNAKKLSARLDEYCTECGCTLSAKTRCLSCKCPLDTPLWKEVLTRKQEEEINKNIQK